jgi:lipoprotein-releasing system permease protein
MVVTDKRADIALLRTLGASTRKIMGIFVFQGAIIGIIGTVLGVVSGVLLALNVTAIVDSIERLFHVQFLSKDVYFISFLPSELILKDVIIVAGCAVVLSLLATLWPAWRATRVEPAKALRQD